LFAFPQNGIRGRVFQTTTISPDANDAGFLPPLRIEVNDGASGQSMCQ
jgi:hypothetical protein